MHPMTSHSVFLLFSALLWNWMTAIKWVVNGNSQWLLKRQILTHFWAGNNFCLALANCISKSTLGPKQCQELGESQDHRGPNLLLGTPFDILLRQACHKLFYWAIFIPGSETRGKQRQTSNRPGAVFARVGLTGLFIVVRAVCRLDCKNSQLIKAQHTEGPVFECICMLVLHSSIDRCVLFPREDSHALANFR